MCLREITHNMPFRLKIPTYLKTPFLSSKIKNLQPDNFERIEHDDLRIDELISDVKEIAGVNVSDKFLDLAVTASIKELNKRIPSKLKVKITTEILSSEEKKSLFVYYLKR